MDWKTIGAVAVVAVVLGVAIYFMTRQTTTSGLPAGGGNAGTGNGGGNPNLGRDLGTSLGGTAGALIQLAIDEANRSNAGNSSMLSSET